MNLSQSSCGVADMPSCSPRCLKAASPAALGRSTAWHLPRPGLLKQRGSLQMQPFCHQYICKSKHGGGLAIRASCAGHSAAPLSLESSTLQQGNEPYQFENPSRKKNAVYALLCIALILACASHSQPGPAFASLTISSSSLGKEGTLLAQRFAYHIAMPGLHTFAIHGVSLPACKVALHWVTGLRSAVRSAWAGLGAGFLHTLSGPDHLAVCPSFTDLLLTMTISGKTMWHPAALSALC